MSSMIQPISGVAQPLAAAAGVKGAPEVRQAEDEAPARARTPVVDEYVPEEKQEPSGRYWLGRDEDGQPKVCFDDPERAEGRPDAHGTDRDTGAAAPEKKAPGGKAERCTGSTDAVDREIETLKKRREELKRQIGAETDEDRVEALEQKLAQVERELSRKDNDTYRRQHTVFS